jgi:phage terminase large subunit-like protein
MIDQRDIDAAVRELERKSTGVRLNNFIPHTPTKKQVDAMKLDHIREVFYGGAAGGGKSDWLLMSALQFVDVKRYSALLLRRTYADLALSGALMDRAQEWLRKTPAKWNAQEKTWMFPSGASITFGYLESEADKFRYQSAEFQFIGFDELPQFSESQYLYMFSRLRRLKGDEVPLRMRSAGNPDGPGLDWVKKRFVESVDKDIAFVPAKIGDNPHLDQDEYSRSLEKLDPVTRARLLYGDWDAKRTGTTILRQWFEFVPNLPEGVREQCRTIDTAWTAKKSGDFTASIGSAMANGWMYLTEPIVLRKELPDVVNWIVDQKKLKPYVRLGMAKAAGEAIAKQFLQKQGVPFEDLEAESRDLTTRLIPFISFASRGLVKLVGTEEQWAEFMDEATRFPDKDAHDDLLACCANLTQMHSLIIEPPQQAQKKPSVRSFSEIGKEFTFG